jgi:hypothetical protein
MTLPEAIAHLAARLRDAAGEAANHLALMRERDRELDQIETAYRAEVARLRAERDCYAAAEATMAAMAEDEKKRNEGGER